MTSQLKQLLKYRTEALAFK